ncbi:sugar ABC transporter substrate-binding protein [Puniceibacterium sediminis]|uniref:Monosaccharide ABC transporter substrate-binding protein, CUT2 family n=1 Tax=Puniceibacterium sediminis TaxID=1608407 RepID=A0A238X4I7_9RHOB|nr:substrate-binding domain-containing protein [Puniceibacterium sediminis]SNR53552.1 monosaccharide ABC transporter substrate-binding protein, CUT2 family [Puniceibacterium sediminis]
MKIRRYFNRASVAALITAMGAVPTLADEAADGLARATEIIESHRAVPVYEPAGEAFDIRKVAEGKKMLSIPNTSANQFLKGIIQREIAVGKEIGLEVREWENQGNPNQWVQGIEYAIANDFDIVDLISGVNPAVVEPQIEAAREAGVKVFTSHFYDPSQPANELLAGDLPVSFYGQGYILGNWMIYKTGGDARAIVVKSDEVPPTAPLVQGIHDALTENCAKCEILQEINVGITEWGTKIQPSLQSALLANPTANYVIPIYDSMSQFVVPAVELTGKSETVKIATSNGTPFVLDFIREGQVEMDIGESLDWIARATIDGYMRGLAGLPMPKDIGVPYYLFDESNIETAGVPAVPNKGYGDDYVKGFHKSWMME